MDDFMLLDIGDIDVLWCWINFYLSYSLESAYHGIYSPMMFVLIFFYVLAYLLPFLPAKLGI